MTHQCLRTIHVCELFICYTQTELELPEVIVHLTADETTFRAFSASFKHSGYFNGSGSSADHSGVRSMRQLDRQKTLNLAAYSF